MDISAKEGYWKSFVIKSGMTKWLNHADDAITGGSVKFLHFFDFVLRIFGLLNIR